VAPWRDDPLRIGYFLDNEVGWWNGALFTWFMQRAPENHSKQRLVALLEAYYGGDWERFTSEFVPPRGTHSFADLLVLQDVPTRLRPGTRGIAVVRLWTALLTARYYAVMSAAVRAADPGALVCRRVGRRPIRIRRRQRSEDPGLPSQGSRAS